MAKSSLEIVLVDEGGSPGGSPSPLPNVATPAAQPSTAAPSMRVANPPERLPLPSHDEKITPAKPQVREPSRPDVDTSAKLIKAVDVLAGSIGAGGLLGQVKSTINTFSAVKGALDALAAPRAAPKVLDVLPSASSTAPDVSPLEGAADEAGRSVSDLATSVDTAAKKIDAAADGLTAPATAPDKPTDLPSSRQPGETFAKDKPKEDWPILAKDTSAPEVKIDAPQIDIPQLDAPSVNVHVDKPDLSDVAKAGEAGESLAGKATSTALEKAATTTVASASTSAGGSTAGGAALAAAANPATIALAGLAAAGIGAAVATKKLSDAFHEEAQKLEAYSPDVAAASAENEIRHELAMLRRAEQIGPQLAQAERLRGRFEESMSDAWTKILEVLLKIYEFFEPAIARIPPFIDLIAALPDALWAKIDEVIAALTFYDDEDDKIAARQTAEATMRLGKAFEEFVRGREDEKELAVDPFFEQFLASGPKAPQPAAPVPMPAIGGI